MRLKDDRYRFLDEETKEAILKMKVDQLYEKANQILDDAASAISLEGNPYKGRPLNLTVNPYDKGMGMAHRMLKSTGFTLPWIADKQEIVAEKRDIQRSIDEYVEATGHRLRQIRELTSMDDIDKELTELAAEHEAFYANLHERISRLRRRIERYNLETPLVDQQVINVHPDDWLAQVRGQISELTQRSNDA